MPWCYHMVGDFKSDVFIRSILCALSTDWWGALIQWNSHRHKQWGNMRSLAGCTTESRHLLQHRISSESQFNFICLQHPLQLAIVSYMMTSSNGNIFRVTGLLCGEFTGLRWIPRTKASDAKLWCFFFICAWINGWVNDREAGDLRRHLAHYDITVMSFKYTTRV